MAVTSASGAQSASRGLWAQLQLQLARRTADQAEQQASALQAQARSAQSVADRAQGDASQARLDLANRSAVGEVQSQLSDLQTQIGKVLESGAPIASATTSAPVVNTSGQQTGTLVNVTA